MSFKRVAMMIPILTDGHTRACFLSWFQISCRAVAQIAFEDAYLTIFDVDGTTAADRLRHRMEDQHPTSPSEQSWLLHQKVVL